MTAMNVELVLTGPYTGATKVLNGHYFENGVCRMVGDPNALAGAIKYLGRCYQAYPRGSVEHQEAVNGKRDSQADAKQGAPEQVQSDLQPRRSGPAADAAVDRNAADAPAEGTAGVLPSGDGQENAGLPSEPAPPEVTNEKLKNVILALDPDNDGHWTQAGKPAMTAVEEAYGSTDITRRDVTNAVPNWDRETAREARDLEDLGIGANSQEQVAEEGARD